MKICRTLALLTSTAALSFGLTGCEKNILDGPIPECKLLISESYKNYVAAGIQSCEKTRTLDEKIKNVGCEIKDRHHTCRMLRMLSGS
jgi:hypothetical protein